jgi:signal transduction histidine kinase
MMSTRGTTRGKLWSNKRFRLLLTLELAVMLPAAALIFVNLHHLKGIQRDKQVEATIHRDFQYILSIGEKEINQKAYDMVEELRLLFPSPDGETEVNKGKALDLILANSPQISHIFLYERDKGFLFRTQPQQMTDPYVRSEHDRMSYMFGGWFGLEAQMMLKEAHRKNRPIHCFTETIKRSHGSAFMLSAFFPLPQLPKDRVVIGGVSFDPTYMNETFFPGFLEELIAQKKEEGGNDLAMMVYPADPEENEDRILAASSGWGAGKPEVSRNLDEVFRGLALGIKFQGTTVEALGRQWVLQSFLILGALSLLLVGGLVLTYRSVNKEVDLARLKSDFVSNVSHELRTPLALIRLYAETLELGRIRGEEKKEEYYRIIRKESERLTALINNILDFSRIEAGRKEYDFRETDIADLVRNTLDSYRYQIEQQGFAFEQTIDPSLPVVKVDREAIARALVNLVNNALKYSADEKFLGVKLFRADDALKLEVIDHGIGIERRDQAKIFEKFYRTCDPLVHDTKGSGLGLSLVRHITQAHGGKVEVESTPGKGSKFTLSLPLTANIEQAANNAASGASA